MESSVLQYTQDLCKVLESNFKNDSSLSYTFTINEGRKYFKIIMVDNSNHRSVHAFVDKKTGEVYKPATWQSPAKGVRYCLLNEVSRNECFRVADWAGSYLYLR